MKKLLFILLCLPMIGFGQSACSQLNYNGTPMSSWIHGGWLSAADITVNNLELFELTQIKAIISAYATNFSQVIITDVTVNYYTDNNGVPGTLIGTETIIPTNQILMSSTSNGSGHIFELILDVTPFTFAGPSPTGGNFSYWIGITNANTNGGFQSGDQVYWDHGYNTAGMYNGCNNYVTGTSGVLGTISGDFNYTFNGNCSSLSGCTDSLALNYNPSVIYDDGSCCYDCGSIEGFIYEDVDTSGTFDSIVETPFGPQIIQLKKSSGELSYLTSNTDGYYSFIVDTGQQVITYSPPAYWESSNNNTQYVIDIQADSTYSGLDFGIIPEFTKGDMTVEITTSAAVCNMTQNIWLTVRNEGTETITNVDLDLWINNIVLNTGGGTQQSMNHISWNLPGDFHPYIYTGEEQSFNIDVQIPAAVAGGLPFVDSVRVTPVQSNLIEIDLDNNFAQVSNPHLCAYDPNDKQVLPKKCFYNELDTLDFTIRFQNTGNYPATTVTLIDSLDLDKLDIMSFHVLGASHDYEWSLKVPSVLEVVFDNIMLVDSSVSFNESQGFFKYRIVVRDSLVNTQPSATPAFIYFDLNAPVVTNLPEINFVSNLSASMQSTNILCNGANDGTATLNISSLTPPYTINWSGGDTTSSLSNLAVGTYSVTLTDDKTCVYTDSVSITEPASIVSLNSLSICDGQSVTVGSNTYNTSGTYTDVLSTLNGCDSTATLNLTINPSTSSTSSATACNDYSWNGINYTSTGSYTWLGSNSNGCDSTATLNLTIHPSTTSTSNVTECYTYEWNGTAYTSSGTYTYSTTNSNGCDSTATLNLTVSVIGTVFQVGLDLEVSVVGGNSPYSYQWNTGEITQAITPLANGDYWVIITDINTCESDSAFFTVNWISTSIEELNINKLSIYPNPSNDVFNIVFGSNTKQDIDIRIHNVLGEVIFIESLTDFSGDYNRTVDMTPYPNAIYILQLSTKDGMLNRKLVLEK